MNLVVHLITDCFLLNGIQKENILKGIIGGNTNIKIWDKNVIKKYQTSQKIK